MSPFSRVFESNQITSNANLAGQNTRGGVSTVFAHGTTTSMSNVGVSAKDQSDVDEMSTFKNYFGGKNNQ